MEASMQIAGKMIAVERKLWSGLQRMTGDVARQAMIDGQCVDFHIPSARLAIEVAGVHDKKKIWPRLDRNTARRCRITFLLLDARDVLPKDGPAWALLRRLLSHNAADARARSEPQHPWLDAARTDS